MSRDLIFFDLETKNLIRETEPHLLSFFRDSKTGGFTGSARDLTRIGKFPTYNQLVEKMGEPRLTPWMNRAEKMPRLRLQEATKILQYFKGSFLLYDTFQNEIDIDLAGYGMRAHKLRRLGISVAVTWDSENRFRYWTEDQVHDLIKTLTQHHVIVGANLINFDYRVLERYERNVVQRLGVKTVDLLAQTKRGIFFAWLAEELAKENYKPTKRNLQTIWGRHMRKLRKISRSPSLVYVPLWYLPAIRIPGTKVSLNAIAKATLGVQKFGKSANAPKLYRENKLDELHEYCQQDVRMTREIFDHGRNKGEVKVKTYDVPVRWNELTKRLVRRKRKRGPRFELECLKFQETLLADSPSCYLDELILSWKKTAGISRNQEFNIYYKVVKPNYF